MGIILYLVEIVLTVRRLVSVSALYVLKKLPITIHFPNLVLQSIILSFEVLFVYCIRKLQNQPNFFCVEKFS